MSLAKIIMGEFNKEMTHNSTVIAEAHRNILDRVQLYFNKEVYVNYKNSEYHAQTRSSAVVINMWSAESPADMILPEKDTAFGFKYCTDGVFVPNTGYATVGEDTPLLQYKDNTFYFLYDVCEYDTEDELQLMNKLINDMLVVIAGSEELVEAVIAKNARIEKEKQLKAFVGRMSEREKQNKRDRQARYEDKKRTVEDYRKYIRKTILELAVEEEMLRASENAITGIETRLLKELDIMRANKKIRSVDVDNSGYIIIKTDTIFANVLGKDKIQRRYRFGDYRISIDASNGSVKFINENNSDKRHSCWGNKCNHPHVNESGTACLGSASSLIMDCVDKYEWGALADVLVNYLESVNIDDSAGKYFYNWDEVDKDGVKLKVQYDGSY